MRFSTTSAIFRSSSTVLIGKADVTTARQRLVELWRKHHPEAANEPPSEAHRPLMLYSKKGENAHPDDPDEVWVNDIYQVTLRRRPDLVFGMKGMIHLGISSHDGTARHDWRHMQWSAGILRFVS